MPRRLGGRSGRGDLAGLAQDPAPTTGEVVRDVILVTATKRPEGVDVQDAPVAVTAYSGELIDALNVRDLEDLSYYAPNIQLEDIGTSEGIANFSIRGLGVNSSIPSIDPTVGVFLDGMYLGINSGVILDTWDLEAVEVLRGPQGILFGRNVTGGAVLVRTTTPTDEFRWSARAAVESGLNTFLSGVVSGPLSETFSAKLALYGNWDEGYHENLFDGSEHGEGHTYLVRPAFAFRPNDSFETILRLEYGEGETDGPASQNHVNGLGIGGLFPRDSHRFSIDETGFATSEWFNVINETNLDVAFGNGTITNIFGWRDYQGESLGDIDATPSFLFHAPASVDQEQWSNELRYAGTFGSVDVTAGLFYFEQELGYVEQRLLLFGLLNLIGGGSVDTESFGAFTQFDWNVNENLIVSVGGRYSEESKDARVQTLLPAALPFVDCEVTVGCSSADFVDSDEWDSFSPKIGVQYFFDENTNIYGFWTQGFRSGGYNLRNTNPAFTPGPFDQEQVDSFEAGLKTDFADGLGRLNLAVFHNDISDMQREVNLASSATAVVQIIRNTADATIQGFEGELTFQLADNLVFLGSLGYVDGDYDSVLFDISGDGVVDETDLNLDIPRLAPWTYNLGLVHDLRLEDWGTLVSRVNYSYRDEAAYTDNNLGFFDEANILDVVFTFQMNDGRTEFSIYGRNVLDEVTYGNDTQLPATLGPVPLGGTFSPLDKGKIWGVELRLRN
ncbi:TonB-dependent receptor [Marinicauda algicola]|uniref:TonB-dependent receptor n=1 Tax=Marinicauda algicola TaxID=2029849 RepID=UPI0019D2E2F6|nr:TonB-dependent receptor [Marinicauda algicola]